MCGIVAIHAFGAGSPPVEHDEVLRIRDSMRARGPDGAGYWESERRDVALGHRRLAILDPTDRGAQPMLDPTGRLAIAFNGEIYNYRSLRSELEAQGHVFRTGSDTEVLLALYAEHGPKMVEKLRGMYAFSLWDERERALVIARDPYGIKPLYVSDDGKTVRVASQVKALLAGGAVDATLDPAGIVGFLVWGHVPEPVTLHASIRAHPPGEVAVYREGKAPQRSRFSSMPGILVSGQRRANGKPWDGPTLREYLLDSVRHHLVSDVPVGLFLSAGLDSRALARLCRDAGGDVLAVTLGFAEHEGTPRDEVPLARQVASSLGIRHDVVRVTRADFDDRVDDILEAMDQPSIDGVNAWFVSRAAASLGLKVALSGLGGDELFGGYPSFTGVPRAAKALSVFTAVPGAARMARRALAPLASRVSSPKWAGLFELGGTLGGAYLLRRGLFMPWELPSFLDSNFVRSGWEALSTLSRLEGTVSGLLSDRLRVTALESSWYMRNQLLRDSDWAGMAHSLEIRVPLADVALTRSLVPALAAPSPPGKTDMIEAVEPEVPQDVLSRRKTGFVPPVAEWVSERGTEYAGRGLRGWARLVLDRFVPGIALRSREDLARRVPADSAPLPGPRRAKRVVVSTLPPSWGGGVPRMARFAADCLRDAGQEPILAWYRPFSEDPYLSPAASRLGIGAVGERLTTVFDGLEGHELGARLPELEFNHYHLSRRWRELLESADACVAASGNCLAAQPFYEAGRPYLAWVATPWRDDRQSREEGFTAVRRLGDALLVRPAVKRLEQAILQRGRILSLSQYTRRRLEEVAGERIGPDVLPVPVDAGRFRPDPEAVVPGRVGFVGRLDDPRKRIGLFVETIARCRDLGFNVRGILVGGRLPAAVVELVGRLNLDGRIVVHPCLGEEALQALVRTFDVFLVPSEQEGLCIAALEAMASGVPVVSTRCGGPEEYVVEEVSGFLCESDPECLADAVLGIAGDRELRRRLGEQSRELVAGSYSPAVGQAAFVCALDQIQPGMPMRRERPAATSL